MTIAPKVSSPNAMYQNEVRTWTLLFYNNRADQED